MMIVILHYHHYNHLMIIVSYDDDDDGQVERHLLKDIMQSTKPWIEELMTAGYKVIIIINIIIMIIMVVMKNTKQCSFALKQIVTNMAR